MAEARRIVTETLPEATSVVESAEVGARFDPEDEVGARFDPEDGAKLGELVEAAKASGSQPDFDRLPADRLPADIR